MVEEVIYNTDINNDIMDEGMKEVLDGLDDEVKLHFLELGYRLLRLRNVFNNLQQVYKMRIGYNSMSENHLETLRGSLRHDLERAAARLLTSKVVNSISIFSDEGVN